MTPASNSTYTPKPDLTRIEDLTRREFMSSAFAAALLIACGDDDDDAEPLASTGTGFPTRITHMFGETVIPAKPTRVVIVGWTEQDAVLALGVVPLATTEWFGGHPGAIHPWAQDELGGAPVPEVLTNEDGIQFERIAALEPDLILALYAPFDLNEETYGRLSQIAPTVAPPAGTADGGLSWQELTRTVGIALGEGERADALVADVEALFAKAKQEHPEFVGAVAVNAYPAGDGAFVAYPPPDPGGRLLTDLGFVVPQEIIDLAEGQAWVDLSAERLELLDNALVLWLVDSYAARDALLDDPIYAQLDVAKQGRHVFLAYEEDADLAAASSITTVLSLPFLLENLVPKLAAAIDGDPDTTA